MNVASKLQLCARFLRDSAPRGIALFFAAFALLNLFGELRSPGFDSNLWWIDLRFLPVPVINGLMLAIMVVLAVFGLRSTLSRWWKLSTVLLAALFSLFALLNAAQFYIELARGNIHSSFPLPLSSFISAAFAWIAVAAWSSKAVETPKIRWLGIPVVFSACVLIFPILQVLCLGKTDYRRSADAIVVLGARAYADGKLSDALADRVRTGVELYKGGFAKKLIFSGGPGDGAIHETEAMRRFAVQHGVKDEDILVDELGLNTQATVKHTQPMLQNLQAQQVLVVSHFYHLPRIKLTYARAGRDVFTVPAREAYFLRQTPYMVLREVAGLWVYYLRPLNCDC
ncbi:MAG: YdcF family protein [Verrucomicrobia bacterium]|nr:YdcF family protein [Verrucomicrobiota bacterium]